MAIREINYAQYKLFLTETGAKPLTDLAGWSYYGDKDRKLLIGQTTGQFPVCRIVWDKSVSGFTLAEEFKEWIREDPRFELLAPVPLNTVCFRIHPGRDSDTPPSEDELDRLNRELLLEINAGGRMYITHTSLSGKYTLRFCIGQTETKREHVLEGWRLITDANVVSAWQKR